MLFVKYTWITVYFLRVLSNIVFLMAFPKRIFVVNVQYFLHNVCWCINRMLICFCHWLFDVIVTSIRTRRAPQQEMQRPGLRLLCSKGGVPCKMEFTEPFTLTIEIMLTMLRINYRKMKTPRLLIQDITVSFPLTFRNSKRPSIWDNGGIHTMYSSGCAAAFAMAENTRGKWQLVPWCIRCLCMPDGVFPGLRFGCASCVQLSFPSPPFRSLNIVECTERVV